MTEKQISEEDLEAAQRAFDDEHDLWDTRRTARGEWWVTRNDEIMLTAYDDLVAEGEMHNMRDDAGVKAVLQALQNRGWRRREDVLADSAKIAFDMIDAEQALRNRCPQGTTDRAIHDYAQETAGQIYRDIRSLKDTP